MRQYKKHKYWHYFKDNYKKFILYMKNYEKKRHCKKISISSIFKLTLLLLFSEEPSICSHLFYQTVQNPK